MRRKLALSLDEARAAQVQLAPRCALCGRPLGTCVEWHHVVPKSEGGTDTVPVHPICHRTIHATFTNAELARDFADLGVLVRHPAIARFVRWVMGKPPDFHAPTQKRDLI